MYNSHHFCLAYFTIFLLSEQPFRSNISNTINYTPIVLLVTGLIWSLFVIIDKLLLMFFLVTPCILVQIRFSCAIAPTYLKNCKISLEQTIILYVLYSEQTSYHFFMFEQSSSNTGIYSNIDAEQLYAQSDTQAELLHEIMHPRNQAKKYRQYGITLILTVSFIIIIYVSPALFYIPPRN